MVLQTEFDYNRLGWAIIDLDGPYMYETSSRCRLRQESHKMKLKWQKVAKLGQTMNKAIK